MKRIPTTLLVVALLFMTAAAATAQTDYSQRGATTRFSFGAGAAVGVAVPIGDLADSIEAAPGICMRFGVNLAYPFTKTVGVFLNAGYDTRGVGKKVSGALDAQTYRMNYFYFEPGVSISAFQVSMNVGLPLGGSMPNPLAADPTTTSLDVDGSAMETLMEPRVGAMLVLMDESNYWMGLRVNAGLQLNSLLKESATLYANDIPNTTPFTAHIGLTFQFALPH